MNYDGKNESVKRRYNSLKNFIGMNKVYRMGDVLCVSSRNNGDYDVELIADGTSSFIALWKGYKESEIRTLQEISAFLSGFSGKRTLLEILQSHIRVVQEDDGHGGTNVRIVVEDLSQT